MKPKKFDIENYGNRLRKNPFTVPEGYFDKLSSQVLRRIHENEESKIPVRHIGRVYRSWIAMAASIIGFALVSSIAIKLIIENRSQNADYLDIAFLEEMNIIQDDSYLIDYIPLDNKDTQEEDQWVEEAVEYLASTNLELELLMNEY